MHRRSFAARKHLLVDFSESDLIKLKLQHRRAEIAKRVNREETKDLLSRQTREIERLQDEQEELLLKVPPSCSRWTDVSVVQDLTAMLARRDRIDEELEAEHGQVVSLKDQILKLERRLAGQKTGGGTIDSKSLIKNTRWTESKLYKGRTCLNMRVARNGELREELQTLQMEKKQFLQVQSHLENELHAIRKNISYLRTICTEAFNASVKSQERRRKLMDQSVKDVADDNKERDNLFCCSNFEFFFAIKAIVRNNQDTDHRKVKHKQLESKELALEEFEDAVRKILVERKDMDLDKLVRDFIQMEEQNNTLLKFVNYQHSEADAIGRRISQLCNEREIFAAEERRQKEQLHALRMKVSVKQETTEQHLAAYQQRVEVIEKLLDQLTEGVKSLLRISCDRSVTGEQSGSSDRVQDENVAEYLSRAENRVNELLTLQSFLHFKENLNPWDFDGLCAIAGQLLGSQLSPAVNQTIAAEIPSLVCSDYPDVLESLLLEEKEPLSRDDLLILIQKRHRSHESLGAYMEIIKLVMNCNRQIQRRRKTDSC